MIFLVNRIVFITLQDIFYFYLVSPDLSDFIPVLIINALITPITEASASIAIRPSLGFGMNNNNAIKRDTAAPNRPIAINCFESFPLPISFSKSMGVFIILKNLSTIARCSESLAGAKNIDNKNPKVPAPNTLNNFC